MPVVKINGKKVKVTPKRAAKIRANRNPLYNPMTPLKGAPLKGVANQLTNLEIKPQVAALNTQAKTAATQGAQLQQNAGDYYQQVALQAQQGLDRTRAINATMLQGVERAGQTEQNRITSAEQMASGETNTDASVRGSGLQIAGRVQEELAAARAQAAARSSIETGGGYRQAGSYENMANQLVGTTQLAGAEQQTRLGNRMATQLADIASKKATVQASRGGIQAKNVQGLRDKQFENQVVMQGILGDQQALQYKASEAQANRQQQLKLQRQSNKFRLKLQNDSQRAQAKLKAGYDLSASEKKTIEDAKMDIRRGVDPKTGRKLKPSQMSPAQKRAITKDRNKTITSISQAVAQGQRLKKEGKKRGDASSTLRTGRPAVTRTKDGTRQTIAEVPSYDDLVTTIGLDVAYDGRISRTTARLVKKRFPGLLKYLNYDVGPTPKATAGFPTQGLSNALTKLVTEAQKQQRKKR